MKERIEQRLACKHTINVLNHSESLRIKIHLFNLYIDSNAITFRKINREFKLEICDVVNELLLVLFSLSSVDDKHNVRNSHASLSNISGQDNLKKMQSRAVSDPAAKNTISVTVSLVLYLFFFLPIHFNVFLNGLVNFLLSVPCYATINSTFLTPAGGTVKAAAWSLDERVECRATILYLQPVVKLMRMKKLYKGCTISFAY